LIISNGTVVRTPLGTWIGNSLVRRTLIVRILRNDIEGMDQTREETKEE
jgi:hypothetical protein